MVLLVPLVLSACALLQPLNLPMTVAESEERTVTVAVPDAHAWINPPGVLLVAQRGLVNGSEQRIALKNATTLGGENQAILRTRNTYGLQTRLRFEEIMVRVGGAPFPFEDVEAGELMEGEDAMGAYFWAERRFGADTLCVLALRRIAAGARQLPDNANFMDIVLRNCIRGSAEEALIPILASSVSTAPTVAPAPGRTRLISPLAGPTIE